MKINKMRMRRPECVRVWTIKPSLCVKDNEQTSHLYGFSPFT